MQNNRPKAIFCDIDGTLWNHVGPVSEQTKVKNMNCYQIHLKQSTHGIN